MDAALSPAAKAKLAKFYREYVKPVLIAVVLLSAFRSAVADWYYVPSGSMSPSILVGDRILVNKMAYGLRVPFTQWTLARWAAPQRGDVIVFYTPDTGTRYVKRAVGLPGDAIELRDNVLVVNGRPFAYGPLDAETLAQIGADEDRWHGFASERLGEHVHPVMFSPARISTRSFGPVTVPTGALFVMGDNRDNSRDSRSFGFVSQESVAGRAVSVIISFDPDAWRLPRWDRVFADLP